MEPLSIVSSPLTVDEILMEVSSSTLLSDSEPPEQAESPMMRAPVVLNAASVFLPVRFFLLQC